MFYDTRFMGADPDWSEVNDYGYEYPGKHRAERPWRFYLWALLSQWFIIFGLVLGLIWQVGQ